MSIIHTECHQHTRTLKSPLVEVKRSLPYPRAHSPHPSSLVSTWKASRSCAIWTVALWGKSNIPLLDYQSRNTIQTLSLWEWMWCHNYRLRTAYLLLRVNLDKIMYARWDFDASSARTQRLSALDKHQNWSASALFCLNSRAQSKFADVNSNSYTT